MDFENKEREIYAELPENSAERINWFLVNILRKLNDEQISILTTALLERTNLLPTLEEITRVATKLRDDKSNKLIDPVSWGFGANYIRLRILDKESASDYNPTVKDKII